MKFFRFTHKWLGFILAIFLILFSVSGIILNHRNLITSLDVNRGILPTHYRYNQWNNGLIKGAYSYGDSILVDGGAGIFKSDSSLTHFRRFNAGIKDGADNERITNIVESSDGEIFAAGQYNLYRLDNEKWENITIPSLKERITDVTVKDDTLVVLSRSEVFLSTSPYCDFKKQELLAPLKYDGKVSLFKFMWNLHSGELNGLLNGTTSLELCL